MWVISESGLFWSMNCELAGTEELLHRRRNRLGIDQVLRHQAFAFGHRQTLFDRTLDAHRANAELVSAISPTQRTRRLPV